MTMFLQCKRCANRAVYRCINGGLAGVVSVILFYSILFSSLCIILGIIIRELLKFFVLSCKASCNCSDTWKSG
jgi:hypothetical protein